MQTLRGGLQVYAGFGPPHSGPVFGDNSAGTAVFDGYGSGPWSPHFLAKGISIGPGDHCPVCVRGWSCGICRSPLAPFLGLWVQGGTFLCLKYEMPVLSAQGSGSIINISSIAGQVGMAGAAVYVASKHAVEGLTKSAALEVAPRNVVSMLLLQGRSQPPCWTGS
jgi:NAD(P)-dependent dehydrogenase (short-subunit alcohol dehydrogenase family)